jgi:hypothetical protein
MSMVAIAPRIASAFVVQCGAHGDVTVYARNRSISRQCVYREAHQVFVALDDEVAKARQEAQTAQVTYLTQQIAELETRLQNAICYDPDRLAEFACVAQAEGVSLPITRRLLYVLLRKATPSVAKLGRWTRQAALRAGVVLKELDLVSRACVPQVAADEIFAGRQPILMMVEPDSLCWVGGRLADQRDGPTWAQEFESLPNLEQVLRDGGTGMIKGLKQVNAQRQTQGLPAISQQLDHFHVQQEARRALRRFRHPAARALEKVELAEKKLQALDRRGETKAGLATYAMRWWREAEAAFDRWTAAEEAWKELEPALKPFTPEGALQTRSRAEAKLAEVWPRLEGKEWNKVRRMLKRPELFAYLDRLEEHIAAVPGEPQVKRAVLRDEVLRRQPERSQGNEVSAAAARGILMMTALLMHSGGEAVQKVAAGIAEVLRHTWRASSMVEGLNSVLRMQQARHRRLTQEMLDLKRVYWNCRLLRTGKRRNQTPYQRLGVVLPNISWWDLLKIPSEQLRSELSALSKAA